MLEYIFFDAELRDRFVTYAGTLGLSCAMRDDPLGLVVAVPEEALDDTREDDLEAQYALLEKIQAERLAEETGGLRQLAGFRVHLPDGQSCQVPVPPELANRLLAGFTLDEIQQLLDTVARSVLAPRQHLCEILREQSAG